MSTIIRVKRRLNEEKLVDQRIVLNINKRRRIEEKSAKKSNSEDQKSTVLNFSGTINKETDIKEHINLHILKLSKSEAEKVVARKNQVAESCLKKRVIENKEKSQKNRFKVVNFTRTNASSLNEASNNEVTIFDVEEDDSAPTTSKRISEDSSQFVYDIYISNDEARSILPADLIDLNDLSILEYNDYLYSCPRLTGDSDSDEAIHNDDDDDSNDENCYRNDYPDEEDYSDNESIGERQMRNAIRKFDKENDLSSDDELEAEGSGYVHSINLNTYSFEDDLDYSDAALFSPSYAKYKQKVLKEMKNDDAEDEEDSD